MAKNIVRPGPDFDFASISLNQPYAIQGGSYFTKLLSSGQQLYVQTPKCVTRGGIVKSGTRFYADLLFTQDDSPFIGWLGQLEATDHSLIFDKRELWFHNELDLTDIETAFSSPVKVVKSGTSYMVRANLGKAQGLGFDSPVRIFNENEVDLKMTDVKADSPVIAIVELGGVRFSSRSFLIDINVKQMMVVQARNTFDRCMINPGSPSHEDDVVDTILDEDPDDALPEEEQCSAGKCEDGAVSAVERSDLETETKAECDPDPRETAEEHCVADPVQEELSGTDPVQEEPAEPEPAASPAGAQRSPRGTGNMPRP